MRKFWAALLASSMTVSLCFCARAGILDGYRELVKAIEEVVDPEADAPEIIASGDYEYYVSKEQAAIVNYLGEEETLVFPSEIDGYPVTEVGDEAFAYLEKENVSIPDSIRSIGKRAFEYAVISGELLLPDNITISEDAFSYAKFPSSVVIPAGSTVEKCAFSYCGGMQNVEIGSGAVIKSRAFGYCDDLQQAICAEDVLIEEDAFEYCPNLEISFSGTDAQTEGGEPSADTPVTGGYLYQALGNEKLANIMNEPPVELLFHVDQGGDGRTAVFSEGEALDQAVALLCNIRIGEETDEWVTDNYNWISAEWADGSETFISLNLNNLEYYKNSETYLYKLENLADFWSYCESYLEEDAYEPDTETGSEPADNNWDEPVAQALELIREAWLAQAEQNPDIMPKPYVDIKNTRIIKIAGRPVNVQMDNAPVEELEDIDYIIEFMMLTNYYGDSLPVNVGICDTVAIHRDGKMEVQKTNLFNAISGKYFMTDLSGVIHEVIDLGSTYNGQLFE